MTVKLTDPQSDSSKSQPGPKNIDPETSSSKTISVAASNSTDPSQKAKRKPKKKKVQKSNLILCRQISVDFFKNCPEFSSDSLKTFRKTDDIETDLQQLTLTAADHQGLATRSQKQPATRSVRFSLRQKSQKSCQKSGRQLPTQKVQPKNLILGHKIDVTYFDNRSGFSPDLFGQKNAENL